MKKLLLCTAALTMFAGSALALNNSNVKADNTQTDSPFSDSTDTFFKIDNTNAQTSPVNPEDPNSILETPDKHNVNPNNAVGPLKIDAVPKSLDFHDDASKDNNISSTIKSGEQNQQSGLSNFYYTQVSDFRDTSVPKGWELKATMSNMTLNNDESQTLKNASITFTNKLNANNSSNDGSKAYPAYSSDTSKAPSTFNNVKLQPGITSPMMTAASGYGSGTWFDYFDSITLNANRSTQGSYKGTITWNLSDGVTNNGTSGNSVSGANGAKS